MFSMLSAILVVLATVLPTKSQDRNSQDQEIYQLHDSALYLLEHAQLPLATSIMKQISQTLFDMKEYEKYFEGQYYICVSYLVLDRNPKAAEDSLKANLDLAINLTGEKSLATSEMYFGLGWLNDQIGREGQALEYYKIAYDAQSTHLKKTNKKLLKTTTNYAQLLAENRKYGRAEAYFLQLLKSYEIIYPRNHPEFVRLYTMAFHLYSYTNEYGKALEYALAAYDASLENYGPNNPRMLSIIRNLSQAYDGYDQTEKGIEYAFEEMALIKKIIGDAPHERKAQVLNNIGRFYDDINIDSSIFYLQQAVEVKVKTLGEENSSTINTWINLASSLNEIGAFERARKILIKVDLIHKKLSIDPFEINPMRAQVVTVENLVYYAELDTISKIILEHSETFKKNISHHIYSGDRHTGALNLMQVLAELYVQEEAPTKDILSAMEYINWFDSVNQQTLFTMNLQSDQLNFLGDYSRFNGAAIDLYYEMYRRTGNSSYLAQMLNFSEKNKATILSPEYTIARLKDKLNVPVDILEMEREISTELAQNKAPKDLNRLKKIQTYDSLKSILKNNYPDYYALKYDKNSLKIDELQNHLNQNSLILTYNLTSEYLYRLAIGKSEINVKRMRKDSVKEAGLTLRSGIEKLSELDESSDFLYKALIPDGIESSNLIICTENFLASIPFEALTKDDQYLGISNPISYTPSLGMWVNSKSYKRYPPDQVLGLAPDFHGKSFQNEISREALVEIPGAKEEISNISNIFSGEWLVGTSATLKNFIDKLPDYGVIHLATHATVDEKDPNFSRLYFSQTDSSQTYISNFELYNLDIKANLVTLSACNTGKGAILAGEGPNSFARGFMYSGVPSTVVSLWPASDKSTPELMKYFYQNLKEGQSKDIALSNARKQYLEKAVGKARHPFYWGGFVLIGSNEPVPPQKKTTWFYVIWLFVIVGFVFLVLLILFPEMINLGG